MTPIRLNGKKYKVPSCWAEVTVKQYIQILSWDVDKDLADRDYWRLLNILTDNDFKYSVGLEGDVTLISVLGWVIAEPLRLPKDRPKHLRVGSHMVDIVDPGEMSIGQNIHLRREIEKSKYLEEMMPIAMGIYLQPQIDGGGFSLSRARVIAQEVERMPIYQIHSVGFFLLTNARDFGSIHESRLRRHLSSLKRMFAKMSLN